MSLALKNTGSAPTYDPWAVQLRLTDSTGHLAATLPLPIDLRKQLPGLEDLPADGDRTSRAGHGHVHGVRRRGRPQRLPGADGARQHLAALGRVVPPGPGGRGPQRHHHLSSGLTGPLVARRRPPTGLPVGGRLPCAAAAGWVGV